MEDRYASAAGWQPPDPYKKQREKARREYYSKPQPGQTMLDIRPASHWIIAPSRQKPRPELYGPMWLKGDVCLLFGPKSVGKSLFAVQLAEDIATGRRSLTQLSEPAPTGKGSPPYEGGVAAASADGVVLSGQGGSRHGDKNSSLITRHSSLRPKVLLIDFEHTTAQFTERYTYPSPIPGKLPCRTRFHFQRASIGEIGEIPACFKGSVHKYLQHSIGEAIYASEAEIVILDSINYLFRGPITATTMTNVLKTLKLHAQRHNISILATATTVAQPPLRARKMTGAQASLPARYAHELQLATLADSAIILAPSTYGAQYRYTKLLSSRNQVPEHMHPTSPEVLTYSLNSPPARGGVAGLPGRGGGSDLNSAFDIRNSSFQFLGPSNEIDHLRNYAAEAEAADRAQEKALKRLARRSSKQALVDGTLDGSFRRYLLGE